MSPKIIRPSQLHGLLAPRKVDSHKGDYGQVLVIGGQTGMSGAALLCGRAALFCGAGKVHIGFVDTQATLDILHPELMCGLASDQNFKQACVAIGPGLGTSKAAKAFLRLALEISETIVIDADALNLIAAHQDLMDLLTLRAAKNWRSILTPHPLEAARLLDLDVGEIQAQREQTVKALSEKFLATVILKGHASLIANSHNVWINPSGNPALASGGTGDVLTGVCAALLAQGLSAADAACMACYLHGAAADDLVAQGLGPIGMTAGELIPAIRHKLNTLQKNLS
ncbi:MAG: NAD(P)H-hydrate dehydratase [Undibacterium sp.]|nr:NAD(P)H-hydrate dehydratase [Undibacterium sp.]